MTRSLICLGALLLLPLALRADAVLSALGSPFPVAVTADSSLTNAFEEVINESRRTDVSVTPQQALLYHGLQLAQEEEWDEATPFLEEAVRRDPSLASGWEGLGWCYVKTGQKRRARDLWFHLLDLMPEKALPHALIAQYWLLEHDWAKADTEFRKSLAIDPRQFDLRYGFALNLLRIGSIDEAEEVMRALIKEDPSRADIELSLAQTLANRFGDEEALEIYRRVTKEITDNPTVLLERAVLELRMGELKQADQLCLDILAEDPKHEGAMRLRADIAEIAGQDDVEPLKELIASTTNRLMRAEFRTRLANRCITLNKFRTRRYSTSEIIDHLELALEDNPLDVDTRLLLAAKLLENRQYVACRAHLKEILTGVNRHNVNALATLFELEMAEGRFDDALRALHDRYQFFDRSDPMIHYYRARVFTAKGEYAEAMAEARKLEEAGRDNAVLTLRYTGLTESDWVPQTSVRRLAEHIRALQRAGWELISPAEIPARVDATKKGAARRLAKRPSRRTRAADRLAEEERDEEEDPPITARVVDYVGWLATGRHFLDKKDGGRQPLLDREDEDGEDDEEDVSSRLAFAVTFDTARRSAMVLGDEIAREFGVPFALFTSTQPPDQYEPARLGWEEMRTYAAGGNWIIGSGLVAADIKRPVDSEGEDLRAPLANRLWLKDRNRPESLNEWDRRIRREFRDSRRTLRDEMGTNDCPVAMVAYPYGTVGQNGACNIKGLRSTMDSIVSEAASSYRLGFVPSDSGFTVTGDDPLIARRYEPVWTDEGEDVVHHAFEYHPLFLGRRMRAEIAMLMNRPTEANRLLADLRRDGYPEDLCHSLENSLKLRFRNRAAVGTRPLLETVAGGITGRESEQAEARTAEVAADDPERSANSRLSRLNESATNEWRFASTSETPLVDVGHPFVQVDFSHIKANDQIENVRYGAKAGVNLNENLGLSADYHYGEIKQTVRPYWNALSLTDVPYEESLYHFKAEREDYRVGFNWRTDTGVFLFGNVGQARLKPQYTFDEDWSNLQDHRNSGEFTPMKRSDEVIFSFGARWNPADNLSVAAFYDHDFVPSAVKAVSYDSVAFTGEWLPTDTWKISGRTQYWTYSDDNAMFYARGESMWAWDRDASVWYGLALSTISTSDPSDFYWTPYWENRALGLLRYTQATDEYGYRFDFMGGLVSSSGRGASALDDAAADTDGFSSVIDRDSDWKASWGFSGMYRRRLTRWCSIALEYEILALRSYIDHSLMIMLYLHL